MSATEAFAHQTELLLYLGRHLKLYRRETLLNLCLTSKSFHAVFSEILYQHIINHDDEYGRSALVASTLLGNARHFTMLSTWDDLDWTLALLRKMPRLQVFEYAALYSFPRG